MIPNLLLAMLVALQIPDELPGDPFERVGHEVPDPTPLVQEWRGVAQKPPYGDTSLIIELAGMDSQGNALTKNVYFIEGWRPEISHADFPGRPCSRDDCVGRVVFYQERGSPQKGLLIIEGGTHPGDFREALAHAKANPGENTDAFLNCLVTKGLGSPSYQTRLAATNILRRRRLASVPALLAGLNHKDIEVRLRCQLVLHFIETGIGGED